MTKFEEKEDIYMLLHVEGNCCAFRSGDQCASAKLQDVYQVSEPLVAEAMDYAKKSRAYTSNRHDFHNGGLNNKQQKMFEGKLGEKAVKTLFLANGISFKEDDTSYDSRDEYDFLLVNAEESLKVDVKTRTKSFHTRTLEILEQAQTHPKDIFVSARLYEGTNKVKLLGWYTFDDMIKKHQIENNGYLKNYVMYDRDLRPMKDLFTLVLNRFQTQPAAA